MKRYLTGIVAAGLMVGTASAVTIPLFENYGFIASGTNVPPQVDALAFANYGTFQVFTTLPYDFQNVRHFTNRGTMYGSPGFYFDTAFTAGKRVPAEDFLNASGATITSADGPPLSLGLNQVISPSFLNIYATNVSVQGILSAGAGGLLRIEGKSVNLNRGGLEIRRIAASPITPYVTLTNFWPDIGITDDYWALTNGNMSVSTLLDISVAGTNVTVPQHVVTNSGGGISRISFQVADPLAFVQTNRVTETNWFVQAAFVGGNPALGTQVRFSAPPFGGNAPFQTIVVGLSMAESNVVTGDIAFNTLYLKDELASLTNYTVLSNVLSSPIGTYRPASFDLTRDPPQEFLTGTTPSGTLNKELFFSAGLSNNFITNIYASYGAAISSLPIQPPQVPGFDFTNLPGRVEIKAQELNLSRTRIRGNAFVNIDTPNLLSSTNAVVDSPNLNFNLGAIQHVLSVTNLAQQTVPRLSGQLRAWSALWTNNTGFTVTNVDVDATDPTITTTNIVTNVVEIAYNALVVDTSSVQTEAPVVTHDLRLHAKDVNIGDVLNVQRSFVVDADSLTISGSLSLSQRAEYWRGTNAPNLKFLTNNGALFVANDALFVEGRSNRYTAFVNTGTIQASGVTLQSDYFENSGSITVIEDGVRVDAASSRIERGSITSARDVVLSGGDLKFFKNTNTVTGTLILNPAGGLADSGAGSENFWSVRNGFQLVTRPLSGDLLGTTIRTFAPKFSTIDHRWAAADRGPSVEGFKDNAALGTLILGGEFDSVVRFSGMTGNNALYVDQLVLTNTALNSLQAGDLGGALEIDPDFVIYFAASNVPAEQLDGQIEGRLVWVQSFVGPNSAVDVLRRDGRTDQMNRAVRESSVVDSDNDGLPNSADAYPLDPDAPLALTSVALTAPAGTVAFTWDAKPNTAYQVEYTARLGSGDWRVLTTYTNTAATIQSAVARDRVTSGAAQRYYRVQTVERTQ